MSEFSQTHSIVAIGTMEEATNIVDLAKGKESWPRRQKQSRYQGLTRPTLRVSGDLQFLQRLDGEASAENVQGIDDGIEILNARQTVD